MRYHRPRGLHCGTGGCTHCFLRIDGAPNQRSCLVPCREGTQAEGQNAFPNVRFDLLAASDLAFPRYLDAHTTFARPRWITRLYFPIVRRMAGFGKVPAQAVPQSFRKETLNPDVLVVGAGPAGLSAAEAAASEGASVLLAEADSAVGGRLRTQPTPFHATAPEAPRAEGKELATKAHARLEAARVDIRLNARVFAAYRGTWAAQTPTRLLEIRPRTVVQAHGAIDAPLDVPGNDRPGVLLQTAAARMLNRHGIAPASPCIIHGATRDGLLLARDLVACDVPVTLTHDGPVPTSPLADDARRLGIDLRPNHQLLYLAGRRNVRAAVYLTPQGRQRLPCQTFIAAHGRTAMNQLAQQAGAEVRIDSRTGILPVLNAVLQTTVAGLFVAGSAAGSADAWESALQGATAGRAAAQLRPRLEATV